MKALLSIILLLAFGACAWGEYTPEEIAEWREAAANGDPEAQFNHGVAYNNGQGQERNVIKNYPAVVEKLREDFETYWKRVSPGDRDRVVHVVDHESDPETYLHASDWYSEVVPWNHFSTSQGKKLSGDWHIKTEKKGPYRFEVRRWPKEVDASIADIPSIEGNVDAWDSKGGKSYLIYGNEKAPFVALPVASVRLRVGDFEHLKTVNSGDAKATFDVPLDRNEFTVTAELLNSRNEVLAGAYYTYCSRIR